MQPLAFLVVKVSPLLASTRSGDTSSTSMPFGNSQSALHAPGAASVATPGPAS
jgi:hypothetical protein